MATAARFSCITVCEGSYYSHASQHSSEMALSINIGEKSDARRAALTWLIANPRTMISFLAGWILDSAFLRRTWPPQLNVRAVFQ